MSLWESALLGVVQGLTEFFPVSSSGHLALMQHLFHQGEPDVFFDVVLHAATLCAVLYYYRRDVADLARRFLRGAADLPSRGVAPVWRENRGFAFVVLILAASVPTGLMGLTLKDHFESIFSNIHAIGAALLITTALVGLTWFFKTPGKTPLTVLKALAIGVAQGVAITPGISRSGATIVCALGLGVSRTEAARFSFLLSVPAIAGALALKAGDVSLANLDYAALAVGFLTAAVSGLLALKGLVALLDRGRFFLFAPYTLALGLSALLLL